MAILNHQLLPQLEIARGMYIRVEGNTDSVGPEIANQKLSERRAQAIVDYLVSRGIEQERIVGRGNGRPGRWPATRPPRAAPGTAARTSCSFPPLALRGNWRGPC